MMNDLFQWLRRCRLPAADEAAFSLGRTGIIAACAALGLQSSAIAQSADPMRDNPQATNATDQPNISGIWVVNEYFPSSLPKAQRMLRAMDGQPAPLKPWASKLYNKRMNNSDNGKAFPNNYTLCLSAGVPMMILGARYPVQIIQTPGQVTALHEEQHSIRLIYLNEDHPTDPDPTFMGHSTGRWDGDTLVVDTIGLSDKTTIDAEGMPHSDLLHVTERIRRIDLATLENVITLIDPKTFTRPWSIRRTFHLLPAGQHVMEYICENQRNAPDSDGYSGFKHFK
jgi:hypothetical protein